jgi:hypothetical protein
MQLWTMTVTHGDPKCQDDRNLVFLQSTAEAVAADNASSGAEILAEDGGRYFGFIQMITRRKKQYPTACVMTLPARRANGKTKHRRRSARPEKKA